MLVLGASGGVGTCCVQFAKQAGATVIAAASSGDRLERLKGIGADVGINCATTDWVACLLVPIRAARGPRPARAAVLVAVPDPDGPLFPDVAREFRPLPAGPLPFPTLVIGSDDDRYGSAEHAGARATQWHAAYVGMGRLSHINNDSGLGDWPAVRAVIGAFLAGSRRPHARR